MKPSELCSWLMIFTIPLCVLLGIAVKGCDGAESQIPATVQSSTDTLHIPIDTLRTLYFYGNRPFVELEASGYQIRPSNWQAERDWQEYRVWNGILKEKEYAVVVRKDTVKEIHIAWF